MKKKLEAELISIAHRILKMKNREDVVQLHQEAQKLYEKLSILRFYEENIAALKPTLTQEALEEKMEQAYEAKVEVVPEVKAEVKTEETAEEVVAVAEVVDEIPAEEEKIVIGQITIDEDEMDEEEVVAEAEEEPVIEEEEELTEEETPVAVAEEPKEEPETLLFEPVAEEVLAEVKEEKKAEPKQITFDDLLGNTYTEPEFVKVNDVPKEVEMATESTFEKVAEVLEAPVKKEVLVDESPARRPLETIRKEIEAEKAEYKALSLNDKFNKTITLSLNDRIAFEKHLFGGSGEDLNRVLSQLNTFNTLEEAKSFIDDLVKPDYNDWAGKDEYSSRFMELVEKKFA
ncbi:hypothetical protein FLJC2902T_02730 [Flavobacterium limnosediminis JC2902]|uniref:Uncharacterized protein n=1 Tax=Flavobacterium limnosediminis JC2902 TaxID=1341181 RepID=V6SUE5_9FLAO|nr:hypothetical protein [Flavobacterium limnosediminis]ESU29797.1 hypothetical protein FLJC2902T_02730 [Flavobacterium limnosediminis JC2902]